MRGGLPPAWLNGRVKRLVMGVQEARQGNAETAAFLIPLLLGGSWGHVGTVFTIFSYFLAVFWAT